MDSRVARVCVRSLALLGALITAYGQAASPAPADAGQALAQTPAWSIGPIDFSGLIDGYYSENLNSPSTRTNQLYNYDVQARALSLDMAELSVAHSPDPIGFQVDFGFGKAFTIIHSGANEPRIFEYIEQAYLSFKPKKAKGLEVDFGEFVSSAGAEVIESNTNWNYSRSLLFAWAVPCYHFGLRTSFPAGKHFTGGVQLVNGWNNLEDNNSGKTLGLTGALTYSEFAWTNTWYTGPEHTGTNKDFRNLYDSVLTLTPQGKAKAYINYDYGRDKNIGPGAASWWGIAGALRIQTTSRVAITPRVEFYDDSDGFTTGATQKLKEVTITAEYQWMRGVVSRLEYRRDWSNVPFFQSGVTPSHSMNQDTITLALVAFFGSK